MRLCLNTFSKVVWQFLDANAVSWSLLIWNWSSWIKWKFGIDRLNLNAIAFDYVLEILWRFWMMLMLWVDVDDNLTSFLVNWLKIQISRQKSFKFVVAMDHAAEKSGFPPKRLDSHLDFEDLNVSPLSVALPLPEGLKSEFKSKNVRNILLSPSSRPALRPMYVFWNLVVCSLGY